jgi:hypothetical protein
MTLSITLVPIDPEQIARKKGKDLPSCGESKSIKRGMVGRQQVEHQHQC